MPDVSVLNRNTAAEEVPIACNVPVWAASRVRLCFTSARGLALWPKCVSCDPVLPKREKKHAAGEQSFCCYISSLLK